MKDEANGNAKDWISFLAQHTDESGGELEFERIHAGDRIRIVTRNSFFEFQMVEPRSGWVTHSSHDTDFGLVRLMGCTFGLSSTIKPHCIFCGGNLEFTYEAGKMVHTTTPVQEIHWYQPGGSHTS